MSVKMDEVAADERTQECGDGYVKAETNDLSSLRKYTNERGLREIVSGDCCGEQVGRKFWK